MAQAAEHLDGPGPVWALTDELMLHQIGVPSHRVSGPFTIAEVVLSATDPGLSLLRPDSVG